MLGCHNLPGSRHPPKQTPHPPEQTPLRSRHPPGGDTPPGADTPQSRHPLKQTHTSQSRHPPPWEQTPPRTRHPPEQTPSHEQTPPREADSGIRSTSGRYASYWNAFLFSQASVCPQGWGWVGLGWHSPPTLGVGTYPSSRCKDLVHYGLKLTRGRYASYWNAFLFINLEVEAYRTTFKSFLFWKIVLNTTVCADTHTNKTRTHTPTYHS